MHVQIVVLDTDDNVWWEMPEDMVDKAMRAETTHDYAVIGRAVMDALKNASEQAAQNT